MACSFLKTIYHELTYSTTAKEVLNGKDLSGKVSIVTGGNAGIGLETVKALALHGSKVIMASRNIEKASQALEAIKKENPKAKVIVMKCDLGSLKSVGEFAAKFKKQNQKLDILICNAGIMGLSHSLTEDGFENLFQTNYLSHIYLIQLLLDVIVASAPSRIVLVSSEAHRLSSINKGNISWEYISPKTPEKFYATIAYSDSKMCMNLAGRILAEKLKNSSVSVFSCHPGAVNTDLFKNYWLSGVAVGILKPFFKTPEQGAATQVYCATEKGLEELSGAYFNNCAVEKPSCISEDPELANKLWAITEKMLGKKPKVNA